MKSRQYYLIGLFPLGWCLVLLSRLNPELTEALYSSHWNKLWVMTLSRFTGIFTFSLFEAFLLGGGLVLFVYLGYIIWQCFKASSQKWLPLIRALLNIISGLAIIYFIFVLFWGLNYSRIPLEESFNLRITPHSVEELSELYEQFILEANEAREHVLETDAGIFTTLQSPQQIFERASLGYDVASVDYPLIGGTYGTPKPILLSKWMSYTNITGIYSPFTAEANVNTNVPESTLLFTTLHEMAHQRGFASENEANFIAFLTSIAHPDADFQYAGYLSALNYTRNALAKVALEQVKLLDQQLSEAVKRDLTHQREFWAQYEGKVEETFTQMNQTYLQLNGVTDGVQSYGRVVDLLLAYADKNH